MLPDREEGRLDALVSQRLEDRLRVVKPRAVVEGQHHLARTQEVVLLEMLKAEPRSAGRVDLDHSDTPSASGLSQGGPLTTDAAAGRGAGWLAGGRRAAAVCWAAPRAVFCATATGSEEVATLRRLRSAAGSDTALLPPVFADFAVHLPQGRVVKLPFWANTSPSEPARATATNRLLSCLLASLNSLFYRHSPDSNCPLRRNVFSRIRSYDDRKLRTTLCLLLCSSDLFSREVGLSRLALADRFIRLIGLPATRPLKPCTKALLAPVHMPE